MGAGVVITGSPIGLHVLVQKGTQRAEGQAAFQPGAAHDVIVSAVGLIGGQQQQHTVVLVGRAKLPVVKDIVGKAFHCRVAQQLIDRVNADLRAAGIGQADGDFIDVVFRFGGKNVRVVGHGVFLIHLHAGCCPDGQRRQHQRRKHRTCGRCAPGKCFQFHSVSFCYTLIQAV